MPHATPTHGPAVTFERHHAKLASLAGLMAGAAAIAASWIALAAWQDTREATREARKDKAEAQASRVVPWYDVSLEKGRDWKALVTNRSTDPIYAAKVRIYFGISPKGDRDHEEQFYDEFHVGTIAGCTQVTLPQAVIGELIAMSWGGLKGVDMGGEVNRPHSIKDPEITTASPEAGIAIEFKDSEGREWNRDSGGVAWINGEVATFPPLMQSGELPFRNKRGPLLAFFTDLNGGGIFAREKANNCQNDG
ncbi:hypothetical protein [Streptomyces sp. SID1121]|uniref:hypothetical protein n=1 Tax=Streptomyces sp. SID1121 TaxID=3425888 RepID=UPI00405776EB